LPGFTLRSRQRLSSGQSFIHSTTKRSQQTYFMPSTCR
jgi:hypothetical protein